jgi:hypothetical protein
MKCCAKCQEWKDETAFMFRYDRGKKRARERTCRECRKTRERNRDREAEHRRASAKVGKTYLPWDIRYPWWKNIAIGYGQAVNLKAHGWRSRTGTQDEQWVRRLRLELPHLYDPTKQIETLVFRARYNLDFEFKSKAIERAHRRRTEEEGGKFFSDGTLAGPVLRRLYSAKHCPYCGTSMRSKDKSLDHVWPKDMGGWHSITNAVVCCLSCNCKKRAMSPSRWLSRIDPSMQAGVLKLWKSIGVSLEQRQLVV